MTMTKMVVSRLLTHTGPRTLLLVVVLLFSVSFLFVEFYSTTANITTLSQHTTKVATKLEQPNVVVNNNSNYSWIGKSWRPPPGIPLYTPDEIKAVFQHRNTLFLGDSTGRRAFATLYAMINSSTPNDISFNDLNLPFVIDVNKKRFSEYCKDRNFDPNATVRGQFWNNGTYLCRTVPGSPSGFGKMDYAGAACHIQFLNIFTRDAALNRSTLGEFDLVVLLGGIWETMRPEICRKGDGGGILKSLDTVIEGLQNASGPNLQIIWRTTGFMENRQGQKMNLKMIQKAKEAIANKLVPTTMTRTRHPNMTFVDWGSQIYPRSFKATRIKGDIKPHYGLEARTLLAQMLMHELVVTSRQAAGSN
jgi:hypothetical protein